jgi:DNA-binding MarR family transcriptional regulator
MSRPDRRLFFLAHHAERALFGHASDEVQRTLGISLAQLGALFHVHAHPGCTLVEVAHVLGLNKSAVTALVRRLERARVIRREPSPHDARSSRLFATTRGAAAVARGGPLLKRLTERALADFTPVEVEVIFRFLRGAIRQYGRADVRLGEAA